MSNISRYSLLFVLILSLYSTKSFSQDKGHMFSHHKIHNPEYTWTSVFRLLGAKSFFYTAVLPVNKHGVLKPEVLFGNVNETTVWYSYNFPLTKRYKIGFFMGPGLSYSFDAGQGARFRWQYGFGTPNISEDIPISLFILSNITHDFNAEGTTWDWYNFGITYQLNKRVKIQFDMEGNYLHDMYTQNNFGFVVDF